MADEVRFELLVAGPPAAVMADWRAAPPAPFDEFELADESFTSLDYVQRYLDWPQKVLVVATFGAALLLLGFLRSTFRLTARFDAAGAHTRVTIVGTAHPSTRRRLAALVPQPGVSGANPCMRT